MAVVNTKSTRVSNADAVSQTLDSVIVNHGRARSVCATMEAANGDSIGSTFRIARVFSSWRITSIKMFCDAITSGAGDVGLYHPANRSSGAVVDADAYASAASIASASAVGIELAYEARNVDKVQNQVWQDAGLTSDPGQWYDLVMTLTAATTAAGTLSFEVSYVAND